MDNLSETDKQHGVMISPCHPYAGPFFGLLFPFSLVLKEEL